MAGLVRIAVLSDLHFSSGDVGRGQTHVIMTRQEIKRQHPYRDLLDLIDAESLKADLVLCPGDITCQADHAALKFAWNGLNKISADLGAGHLFAATGNHDISSRNGDSSPEIWEYLKALSPIYPYPNADKLQRLSYWAEHFLVAETQGLRIVVLNSCNSHARGAPEWAHGRVTDYTISRIEEEIGSPDPRRLNILLCHHHPARHPDLNQAESDYSEMVQGAKLISFLGERDEPWLLVHGHKHSPRIDYAQGADSDVPIIFSAGSFSAVLSPEYFAGSSNQFYIVEIDPQYVAKNGIAGVVRAWDWREGQGWVPARSDGTNVARILDGAGFGHRANPSKDAKEIDEAIGAEEKVKWEAVVLQLPWLRHATPRDLTKILNRLKTFHHVDTLREPDSWRPQELLRRSDEQ